MGSSELVVFIQDTVTKEIFQANTFSMADAIITHYDVSLEEIIHPGDEFCEDPLSPEVVIKNLSFENLVSCTISYEINGELHEYNWEGDLQPDSSEVVILPEVSITLQEENFIIVQVSLPNGEEDENPENNILEKTFYKAQIIEEQQLILELLTDNFGIETSWELKNSLDEIVYSGNGYENNTLYIIEWDMLEDDCYTFDITDEGENGICCENGAGYYLIKDSDGIVYMEGGEFGSLESLPFQIDVATKINHVEDLTDVYIYPNPASSLIYINSDLDIINVNIYNYSGHLIFEETDNSKLHQIDISELLPGLYFFKIETKAETFTRRIIK